MTFLAPCSRKSSNESSNKTLLSCLLWSGPIHKASQSPNVLGVSEYEVKSYPHRQFLNIHKKCIAKERFELNFFSPAARELFPLPKVPISTLSRKCAMCFCKSESYNLDVKASVLVFHLVADAGEQCVREHKVECELFQSANILCPDQVFIAIQFLSNE